MGKAKEIILRVIPAKIATPFIKTYHYSGKVVNNSSLHFGVFLDGMLHGVISFGPSMVKRQLIHLVEGTRWNEFLELNRLAFDDYLPRNSESRALAICFRLLKKKAPHIKWVVSFADATRCGDGTIYRASGFLLTLIKKNTQLRVDPNTGEVVHKITAWNRCIAPKEYAKWNIVKGYQLRYIRLLKDGLRLTVPVIPFSKIKEVGAGMYKGVRR